MTGQAGIGCAARQQACRALRSTRRPATGLADTQEDPTGCARACQERSCDASCPQPVLWPTGNTHLNVRKPGRLHQQPAWQSHLIEPARSSARLTTASMRYVAPRTSEKRLTTEAYPPRSGAPASTRGYLWRDRGRRDASTENSTRSQPTPPCPGTNVHGHPRAPSSRSRCCWPENITLPVSPPT